MSDDILTTARLQTAHQLGIARAAEAVQRVLNEMHDEALAQYGMSVTHQNGRAKTIRDVEERIAAAIEAAVRAAREDIEP